MDECGIPEGTALRVDLPAADLRGLVAHYHAFDSERNIAGERKTWALPTWPMIRFAVSARGLTAEVGPRRYDPVPDTALYGTASYARRVESYGGISVGIAVTPLGWSRLFRSPADQLRDRVVPLATLWPEPQVSRTMQRLRAMGDRMDGMSEVLDDIVRANLQPPTGREREIAALTRLIADDETIDIAAAASKIAIGSAALRRLSTRHFGFPPKLLLVRHRFLRTFVGMLLSGRDPDYGMIGGAYHDSSHFLRDARRFLGTTPIRFAAFGDSYLVARLRAYAALAKASGEPVIYA